MALAGFSKKDIDINVADNQLTVKSIPSEDKGKKSVHRGISKRQFTRTFTLADGTIARQVAFEVRNRAERTHIHCLLFCRLELVVLTVCHIVFLC